MHLCLILISLGEEGNSGGAVGGKELIPACLVILRDDITKVSNLCVRWTHDLACSFAHALAFTMAW